MKKLLVAVVIAAIWLNGTHRLPAPIFEEPSPTATASHPSKSSNTSGRENEHKARNGTSASMLLVGLWSGAVRFNCSDGTSGNWPSFSVAVKSDGGAVLIFTSWTTDSGKPGGMFEVTQNAGGPLLNWTWQTHGTLGEQYAYSFNLERTSSSTAELKVRTYGGGTCDGTGALNKR